MSRPSARSISSRHGERADDSEERSISYSLLDLPPKGKTDWERLERMTDQEVEAAVGDDPDAAPIANEVFWQNAALIPAPPKEAISIRVDGDVLDWFRSLGRGYQTRMNSVLRGYMELHKGKEQG